VDGNDPNFSVKTASASGLVKMGKEFAPVLENFNTE
jgi:hypothetical protein